MKIGITGASGFVGQALLQSHLESGDSVRVLTRRAWPTGAPIETVRGDLSKCAAGDFREFVKSLDVLYHCAGVVDDESAMRGVHVHGTTELSRAAEGHVGRWIQLSSVGVYGAVRSGEVREDAPVHPIGEYECTKAESDRIVESASRSGAYHLVIVRPSNIFGPTMPNRSLRQLVRMVNRGLFFYIGQPGASANYIPLANVIHALRLAASAPISSGQVFNVSEFRTIEQFVGHIALVLRRQAPRARVPERLARVAAAVGQPIPGFPLSSSRIDALTVRSQYPTERITRELGYSAIESVEDCLTRCVTNWSISREV